MIPVGKAVIGLDPTVRAGIVSPEAVKVKLFVPSQVPRMTPEAER
jgi:hypothetical protein